MAGKSSQKYSQKQAVKQRIAAQRLQQARAERRRRLLLGVGGAGAAVIVIVALVIVSVTTGGGSKSGDADPSAGPQPAPAALVKKVTEVSASTFDQMPADLAKPAPSKVTADVDPLTKDGKPEVLYIGAEWCPYCAGERWPMVVALSRFGQFDGLQTTYSAAEASIPALPTLSFRGASYTSEYLAFTPVEAEDRSGKPLETPTSEQAAVKAKLGSDGYPFVDVGNKWAVMSSSINPTLLAGKTPGEVADVVADPNDRLGASVLTSANTLTAAICDVTGDQPANVCSSSTIQAIKGKLLAEGK